MTTIANKKKKRVLYEIKSMGEINLQNCIIITFDNLEKELIGKDDPQDIEILQCKLAREIKQYLLRAKFPDNQIFALLGDIIVKIKGNYPIPRRETDDVVDIELSSPLIIR